MFFSPAFLYAVADTVKCNTCNNIRNSFLEGKKNEKKPSVFAPCFI